jgi:hypothetical protein
MNRKIQLFAFYILIFSIVIYGVSRFVCAYYLPSVNLPLAGMAALLMVINLSGYLLIVKTGVKSPRIFIYSYMGVTIARMLISGAFLILYSLYNRTVAKEFILTFFLMYILYTIFEIVAVFDFFKEQKK